MLEATTHTQKYRNIIMDLSSVFGWQRALICCRRKAISRLFGQCRKISLILFLLHILQCFCSRSHHIFAANAMWCVIEETQHQHHAVHCDAPNKTHNKMYPYLSGCVFVYFVRWEFWDWFDANHQNGTTQTEQMGEQRERHTHSPAGDSTADIISDNAVAIERGGQKLCDI